MLRIKVFIISLIFFFVCYLYFREFRYINLYLSIKGLIYAALVTGATVGLIWGWLLQRNLNAFIPKFQIMAFVFSMSVLFMPLPFLLANRLFGKKAVSWEKVVLLKNEAFIISRFGVIKGQKPKISGYEVFYTKEGQEYSFRSYKNIVGDRKPGATVFPIRTGFFGYQWIDDEALSKVSTDEVLFGTLKK